MSDEKKCICIDDETIELSEGAECVKEFMVAGIKAVVEAALKCGCGCRCNDEGNGNCPGTGDGDGDGDGDGPGTGNGDGDGDNDGECELIDVEAGINDKEFVPFATSVWSGSYAAWKVFQNADAVTNGTDAWMSGRQPVPASPQQIGVTFGDRSFIIKKVKIANRKMNSQHISAIKEFTLMYLDKEGEWHDLLPEHQIGTNNASMGETTVIIPKESRFPIYGLRLEIFSHYVYTAVPSGKMVSVGRIRLCGSEVF